MTRLHGLSRDAWKRYSAGGSWAYDIETLGFKDNLTDLASAIGLVQLERAEDMRRARERVALRYVAAIEAAPFGSEIELPVLPLASMVHAWHLFPIRLRSRDAAGRARVIEDMRAAGIGTSVHFIPLHLHSYYRRLYGYEAGDLPVATAEFEREISLPIFPDLSDADVDRIVGALGSALA